MSSSSIVCTQVPGITGALDRELPRVLPLDFDASLVANVIHVNRLRDLTGRAILKCVTERVWKQVPWDLSGGPHVSWDLGRRPHVLDLGSGDGYHFEGLSNVKKEQIIALDRDPTRIHMLSKKHPQVNIVKGDWNEVEKVLGGRLDGITTVTGFNFMNYVKPEDLSKLLEKLRKLPKLKRLLFINDLAPHVCWAVSPDDIVDTGEAVRDGGIGEVCVAFRDLDAMGRAILRSLNALKAGLPGFSVKFFEEWSRVESVEPTALQRETQRQEFAKALGEQLPSINAPDDLNVFMRMPGDVGVTITSNRILMEKSRFHGRQDTEIPEGKVKEINSLWGVQVFRK